MPHGMILYLIKIELGSCYNQNKIKNLGFFYPMDIIFKLKNYPFVLYYLKELL